MLLNRNERQCMNQYLFTYKLSSNFTYLGIKITPHLESIAPTNYERMFKKLTVLFRNFLWNKKCIWFRLSLLYLPVDTGGLECPNLYWCYLLTQLRTIMLYFSSGDAPSRMDIELCSLRDYCICTCIQPS